MLGRRLRCKKEEKLWLKRHYLLFITLVFSEDNNELVIYQPTSEMVNTYFGMYQYLNDWENNPSKIDTDTFTNLYQNYVGEPVKFFL